MAHVRQSTSDTGPGFQVNFLKPRDGPASTLLGPAIGALFSEAGPSRTRSSHADPSAFSVDRL